MANTLTGIIPTLYEALNVVSREMVGFIPSVRSDSNAERAGLNQTVRVPIGESGALEDVTPGANPAASGDTTVGYADVTIVQQHDTTTCKNLRKSGCFWRYHRRLC